jgi:hypothetical protein
MVPSEMNRITTKINMLRADLVPISIKKGSIERSAILV